MLPSASAVSTGLAEPGAGVVEVPEEQGPAGTHVRRLQAEGRLRGLGRGIGFIPLGASRQGAQEDRKGCREAELAHLHGFAGGLLSVCILNIF